MPWPTRGFTAYKPDLQSVRGRLCALPGERPYEEGDEHGLSLEDEEDY